MFFELLTLCRFSMPFGKYFTKKSQYCSYHCKQIEQLYRRNSNYQVRASLNRCHSSFPLVICLTQVDLCGISTSVKAPTATLVASCC